MGFAILGATGRVVEHRLLAPFVSPSLSTAIARES